jgi:hypothetical protein
MIGMTYSKRPKVQLAVYAKLLKPKFNDRYVWTSPYKNTKKLTKPLLQVASQNKLTSRHWVHFPLKMAVPLTVSGVERFPRVGCIVIANLMAINL